MTHRDNCLCYSCSPHSGTKTPSPEKAGNGPAPARQNTSVRDLGVEPYTRESLESGLRDVRDGLRADASAWDQQCAVEALHRIGATARAGLEDRERLDDETRHVLLYAERYRLYWQGEDDDHWLKRLMQEVGELASSLADDHPDPPETELRQIGSIAVNWLRLRAARSGRESTEKA